jgi:hypothetical protein
LLIKNNLKEKKNLYRILEWELEEKGLDVAVKLKKFLRKFDEKRWTKLLCFKITRKIMCFMKAVTLGTA